LAKSIRHSQLILKKGLTPIDGTELHAWRAALAYAEEVERRGGAHGIFESDSAIGRYLDRAGLRSMSVLTSQPHRSRAPGKSRRAPFGMVLFTSLIAIGAAALVAYLLWPTWEPYKAGDPAALPVSVGATLFNVPSDAIRVKVQRHSGPQERIDLSFSYPSLEPPSAPRRVSSETIEAGNEPIDRIFLSIAAHHDAMSPDVRVQTIYPRYLDENPAQMQDGLSVRAFRAGSPYEKEDLFAATVPNMAARCTRDGETPGMCLSERRVGDADLTFRFPRKWLERWRDVTSAMDRLTVQLHGARS